MEVFSRMPDGKWSLTEFVGLDATCLIPATHAEVKLARLYRDITFDPAA